MFGQLIDTDTLIFGISMISTTPVENLVAFWWFPDFISNFNWTRHNKVEHRMRPIWEKIISRPFTLDLITKFWSHDHNTWFYLWGDFGWILMIGWFSIEFNANAPHQTRANLATGAVRNTVSKPSSCDFEMKLSSSHSVLFEVHFKWIWWN